MEVRGKVRKECVFMRKRKRSVRTTYFDQPKREIRECDVWW